MSPGDATLGRVAVAVRVDDRTNGHTLEDPPGMQQRLARVLNECHALSQEHRLSYPIEAVGERLHDMSDDLQRFFRVWTLEICFLLDHHKVLRFTELSQRLPGMSTRTLAARLKSLQRRGLVQRTHYDESPPHVEYRLTEHGRGLVGLAFALVVYAQGARTA